MLRQSCRNAITTAMATLPLSALGAEDDIMRGAQAARPRIACHSLAPGRHMTGPSLAHVWGRKAGTADGFTRYSDALRRLGPVWDRKNLDAWLKNPAALVPGNAMGFPGIADTRTRGDLVAYLQAISAGGVSAPEGQV